MLVSVVGVMLSLDKLGVAPRISGTSSQAVSGY